MFKYGFIYVPNTGKYGPEIPLYLDTFYAVNNIPHFEIKHDFFQSFFFSSVVIEWNKLKQNTRNLESLSIFKKKFLKFVRLSENNTFNCHNIKGVKLLANLRLDSSQVCEHKFKHAFHIVLTESVAVARILKYQLISFFTVLIL